jgi:hypothetical protein
MNLSANVFIASPSLCSAPFKHANITPLLSCILASVCATTHSTP